MMVLQVTVKLLCVVFSDSFLYVQNFHLYRTGTELDLDHIPGFYIHRRFRRLIIHQHTSGITCLVGNGSALDQAGYL